MSQPLTKPSPILNYRERHCTFEPDSHLIDEKLIDHGKTTPHYDSQNRNKITHKNLRSHLSLTASLTRVQYGSYHTDLACLINFRFLLQGSTSHWRFEKADIRLCFTSTSSSSSANHPVILDYGPRFLCSSPEAGSQYTATLSSTMPPVSLSAGYRTHHSPSTVSSTSVTSKNHTYPNTGKFHIRENTSAKGNCPLQFDCAVVVKYAGAFQGTVDVKAGPVFDFLARPWREGDAAVFESEWEYGEAVREGRGVDFARLDVEEWRAMVTPGLGLDVVQI